MTGMSMNDFLNNVYYGDEIEFNFNDKTYFVQGYSPDGKHYLCVDCWMNNTDDTEPFRGYLFEIICDTPAERLKQFEEAKIFEGKTINEIESEVEVTYG